jgi:hypothetical protein
MEDRRTNRSLPFLTRQLAIHWLEHAHGSADSIRNLCVWLASHAMPQKHARWLLGATRDGYASWKRAMEDAYRRYGYPVLVDSTFNNDLNTDEMEVQHHEQHESADSD